MFQIYRSLLIGCAFAFALVSFPGFVFAASGDWTLTPKKKIPSTHPQYIKPDKAQYFELNVESFKAEFAQSPVEQAAKLKTYGKIIQLPMPDGSFQSFAFASYSMMEPELAARWNFIKTYTGQGLDDPSATCKVDFTKFGFHYQILSSKGSSYCDPVMHGNTQFYQVYRKADLNPKSKPGKFICELGGLEGVVENKSANPYPTITATGGTRREYRLALACTGEYAQFHGGTTTGVASAMVTSVNRVNGVYETEVCVRLHLIANNNLLIFLNATTDGYTNSDGFTLLDENQSKVTSIIGGANYDIGHVFSTGGGGVASKGSVCSSGSKAQGVTGSSAPIGDAYDIDYVAHEMGHQFGGDHTFNSVTGSCQGNRAGTQAYEPGSGTTIMAYAGICGSDDIQPHSNPFFHFASYNQIIAFSNNGGGNSCAVKIATGNTAPVIPAITGGFVIPINTNFKLTAPLATDADGDLLTYSWEESDLGAAGAPGNPAGTAPIFRSYSPTESRTRYFPKLSAIIGNTSVVGERLPTYARALTFRLTVRDNNGGAGGVNLGSLSMTVNASAGPFAVTAPNLATVSWEGGSKQAVTWSVANTSSAPVNSPLVNIKLSTDGGQTFAYTLKQSVANDGADSVYLPVLASTTARILVESATNVFFDMSNANFKITAPVGGNADIATTTASNNWCAGQAVKATYEPTGVTYLPGNVFTLQLSNASGQFTNPVSIGSKTATGADTILAVIPELTGSGTGYKIRVVSSNPVKIGQASTATYTITALPTAPASIIGTTGFCSGANNVLYKVTAQAGATGYIWTVPSGASIVSNPDSNAIFVNMGSMGGNVTVKVSNPCGQGPTTSLPVSILTVLPAQVTTTQNPTGSTCEGSNITFNATPVNGGTNPSFVWLRNDTVIVGAVTSSYATTTLKPGDKIKVVLISSNTCNEPNNDTSNVLSPSILLKKLPTAVVTSSALSNDTTCAGQIINFTATTTTAGTLPTYQWFKNGVAINGATSFTYSTIPVDGDTLKLRLKSSAACLITNTVFSNLLLMHVFALNVVAGADTQFCSGPSVQLFGQPTGGTWTGTGVNISGLFSATAAASYPVQYRVTKYGCSKFATKDVVVKALPTFTLGSDTMVCSSSASFPVGNQTGVTCTGPSFNGGQFNPQTSGIGSFQISCVKTATNGCQKGDSVTITVIEAGAVSYTAAGNDLTALASGSTSYQWFLNNQPIAGATSATYTISEDGSYCVEATFANGCKNKSECLNQIFTSVKGKLTQIPFTVWPNPAENELNLDLGNNVAGPGQVHIQNMLGQTIQSISLDGSNSDSFKLNITQLPAGVYSIRVETAGKTGVTRFVKRIK